MFLKKAELYSISTHSALTETSGLIAAFLFVYTKLVFFNTALLAKPSPTANKTPPTRQSATFSIVVARGVIIGTIINRSIPPPKDPTRASHTFVLSLRQYTPLYCRYNIIILISFTFANIISAVNMHLNSFICFLTNYE